MGIPLFRQTAGVKVIEEALIPDGGADTASFSPLSFAKPLLLYIAI
jgi:hypothetical protein